MAGLLDMTGFLTPIIQKVVDFIPDPLEKAKAQAEATKQMLDFVSAQNTAQLAVDQAEAGNSNVFVAGWRPFIGWVCGAGLAWAFLVGPLTRFILPMFAPNVTIPPIPTDGLMELVFAMLGRGGLRTFEKVKGAAEWPPSIKPSSSSSVPRAAT